MFLFRNSLTTIYSKIIISASFGMSCRSSVSSQLELILRVGLTLKIIIVLKNHARSYYRVGLIIGETRYEIVGRSI